MLECRAFIATTVNMIYMIQVIYMIYMIQYDLGLCFYVDFWERLYICISSTSVKLGIDFFQVTKHNKQLFLHFFKTFLLNLKLFHNQVRNSVSNLDFKKLPCGLIFAQNWSHNLLAFQNSILSLLKNKITLGKHKENIW